MDRLARELETLLDNPIYNDRYDKIRDIANRVRSKLPKSDVIDELKKCNLSFFANKVLLGDYNQENDPIV